MPKPPPELHSAFLTPSFPETAVSKRWGAGWGYRGAAGRCEAEPEGLGDRLGGWPVLGASTGQRVQKMAR